MLQGVHRLSMEFIRILLLVSTRALQCSARPLLLLSPLTLRLFFIQSPTWNKDDWKSTWARGLNKWYAIHPGKIQPSGHWLTSSSTSSPLSPQSSSTETLTYPTKDHIPFKIWSSKSSSSTLMEAFHPHMQITPATVPFSHSLEHFELNWRLLYHQ